MVTKSVKALPILVFVAVSLPAAAQYVATPQPGDPPAASSGTQGDGLQIYAKNGQTQEQQWADRYECHRWAKTQSSFDPTQPPAALSENEIASRREGYRRAMTACLEGRGYTVRYGAPPQPAPPHPTQRTRVNHYPPAVSEARYRPLAFHIDGGYTLTAGSTNEFLDHGPNIGFGFTWFPAASLPIGLRIDGSYSRFDVKDAFLNGSGFTSGHQNIYGGEADLQFDLAHQSGSKLYLFGGAGWYRVQTHLRQESLARGVICDWYFCEPGYFPILTGVQQTTSPWHSSWNAGIGWEVSTAERVSFFVEARYQRIAPHNSNMQFVPIRVGLRF
jgi:opacity protein-like surface antigen